MGLYTISAENNTVHVEVGGNFTPDVAAVYEYEFLEEIKGIVPAESSLYIDIRRMSLPIGSMTQTLASQIDLYERLQFADVTIDTQQQNGVIKMQLNRLVRQYRSTINIL